MVRRNTKSTTPPILKLTRASLAEGAGVLRSRDRRLGRWIEAIGAVGLRRQRHRFGALCRSIIAQQIGAAAARSIHARFLALFSPAQRPEPSRLLRLPLSRLRACGLSARKAEYLRALAREYHRGDLRAARLGALPDPEVIERLTRVPGIGVWTAEMFLIFSLGRCDVFSVRDLALRAGVERVEGRSLTPSEIETIAGRWAPYRSVASLYLWKIAHWSREPPG